MESPLSNFQEVLSCLFLWVSLYHTICIINSSCSYEWNCRIVSTIHAVLITALSYWSAFIVGPWPFVAFGEKNTSLHNLIASLTLGYFIYDFIWSMYMKTEGVDMLMHHIVSICGTAYVLYIGLSGPELIATAFGTEISNPFLQIRWFLRETNRYNTLLAKANDIVFMVLFISVRLGPGTYVFIGVLKSEKSPFVIKTGGTILYFIGWVWAFYIIRFAKKRFVLKCGKTQ